jgi:hypothetical protein
MSVTIVRDCLGVNARLLYDRFGRMQPVVTYATAVPGLGITWTTAEESLFAEKVRLATRPGDHARQASQARGLDIERYDATIDDARPFAIDRVTFCQRHLIEADALLYASAGRDAQYGMPEVISRVPDLLKTGHVRLFVAWYWERGEPTSVEPLLEELHGQGVSADPSWIALWQYAAPGAGLPKDAFWDESAEFGSIAWSR